MPRKGSEPVVADEPVEAPKPSWTPEQLVAVKHLGPGIIGREMYEASQAYVKSTAGGILGPATRG